MKIFVSYSRRDAGDFANQINRHLSSFNYDIFTDVDDIRAGEIWSNIIETNISNCDIFVVIVTRGALQSPHVANEVLQAQKENKKIIPCFFRNINQNKIKWNLDKIQGVEFSDKYELARELDSKINIESNTSIDKDPEGIIGSISKTVKDVNTDKMTPTKSTVNKPVQKREGLQPIPKGRIGALGSGVPSILAKTADDGKTTTKSDIDKLESKKDTLRPPSKLTIEDKIQSEPSRDIATGSAKKEDTSPTKNDRNNKLSQGIFRSYSKPVEETKINAPTTTIKSDTEGIHQKKDQLPPSNVSKGAIDGSSEVPSPKSTAPEYSNKEKEYTQTYNTSQTQGINLKLIIIPIIAIAVIGVIVGVSYFNMAAPPATEPVTPPATEPVTPPAQKQVTPPAQKQVTPPAQKQVTPPAQEQVTPPDTTQAYQFIRAWGSVGTGDGEFNFPIDISVDSQGNVYVVDNDNHRIQKFDSNGNFITKWGSEGSGNGQFYHPRGIALDSSTRDIYIADPIDARIQKFDSNGNFITKWGSQGSEDGEFIYPTGIAVDSQGNVYVSDSNNARIQKFDSTGNFITKWGNRGTNDRQFSFPHGIAVDSQGNVYVSDLKNARIQKFDSNGNFITKWGIEGTGDGEFQSPRGISVDSSGNVYVVDASNYRIQKFDSNGKFITKWGGYGTKEGQFSYPQGIAVDSQGNVYVVDVDNHRIQVFAPSK